MTATLEAEPCAWLVSTSTGWRYARPCLRPSTRTATDGWSTYRLCARHYAAALERGWREVAP